MKITIIYYSMYGHTYALAQAIAEGARSVEGADVQLRRVAELPDVQQQIDASTHAKASQEQQKDIPIATHDDLRSSDAIILGSPTRYGNMTAQVKAFIDTTAGLWSKGELEGKVGAVFTSTASTHGGQESTLLTMMNPLLHLGLILVGVPYSTPGMIHTEGRGSSPYGASVLAGAKGELEPHPDDLAIGKALGRRVAETARKLHG